MTPEKATEEVAALIVKSGVKEVDGIFLALVRPNGTRQFITKANTREAIAITQKMHFQCAKRSWLWWKDWFKGLFRRS